MGFRAAKYSNTLYGKDSFTANVGICISISCFKRDFSLKLPPLCLAHICVISFVFRVVFLHFTRLSDNWGHRCDEAQIDSDQARPGRFSTLIILFIRLKTNGSICLMIRIAVAVIADIVTANSKYLLNIPMKLLNIMKPIC